MTPKIGIGISDFHQLRAAGLLFVDKSFLIGEVLETAAQVILLPRPRRFGKTLNLSMLRYFFERGDEDRAPLYTGLTIRDTPEFAAHQGRYPVIFLTFKDIKGRSYDDTLFDFRLVIGAEVRRHLQDLGEHALAGFADRRVLQRVAADDPDPGYYRAALRVLSALLHQVYGEPVVILLDEYDTPVHAAWRHGYYDVLMDFMRGLLSAAFKDNPHLYKCIVTGILRVAKESIFSGLNNLDVHGILSDRFHHTFGFTAEEVDALCDTYGLGERRAEIDDWYNGYDFGGRTIYNPWSILNFLDKRPERPQAYWANTSSNDLVKELTIGGGLEVREQVETLIRGGAIESIIDENIVFPELRKRSHNLWSLLFFSGYLKCVEKIYEPRRLRCRLSVPNQEVRYIYEEIIAGWIEESFENAKLQAMLKALVTEDLDRFERLLNEFVLTTLSYFDAKGKNPEAVFQAFVLGLLLNLDRDYEVSSNRELGYGRYDVLVLPKDRSRIAVLMELKSIAGFYRQEPEQALAEAKEQVEKRAYAAELEAKGYTHVLRLAVVSDGKRVWVRSL